MWLRPREDEVLWVKEGTQSTVGSCFCCLFRSPKSTPGLAATAHLGVATSTCGTAGQGRDGPGWPQCQRGTDPAWMDTHGPAAGLSWPLARIPQQSPGEQVRGLDAERALGPAAVAGEAPSARGTPVGGRRRPTPAQRPLQMPEDSPSGGVGRPPADDAAQEGQVNGQGH